MTADFQFILTWIKDVFTSLGPWVFYAVIAVGVLWLLLWNRS